jgi:hypothetical protein
VKNQNDNENNKKDSNEDTEATVFANLPVVNLFGHAV